MSSETRSMPGIDTRPLAPRPRGWGTGHDPGSRNGAGCPPRRNAVRNRRDDRHGATRGSVVCTSASAAWRARRSCPRARRRDHRLRAGRGGAGAAVPGPRAGRDRSAGPSRPWVCPAVVLCRRHDARRHLRANSGATVVVDTDAVCADAVRRRSSNDAPRPRSGGRGRSVCRTMNRVRNCGSSFPPASGDEPVRPAAGARYEKKACEDAEQLDRPKGLGGSKKRSPFYRESSRASC
jgi:hypothetical protein